MRKTIPLVAFTAAALFAADQPNQLTRQEEKEGWILLFNGRNLDGWDGDPVYWSVKDGAILGLSDGHPFQVNTFLVYRKQTFSDFILTADVRLRNHNSGIHFRSEQLPGPGWIVRGYQADQSVSAFFEQPSTTNTWFDPEVRKKYKGS